MPTLLLLAREGFGARPELATTAQRHVPNLTLEEVDGGHHFHMEADAAELAQRLRLFLQ